MAETAPALASHHEARQNALADIQFASIADDDLSPSEDEIAEDGGLQIETLQSTIGVSIGQEQTRLTSPKTPAAEKAAALDETDGGQLFDGWEEQLGETALTKVKDIPAPISNNDGGSSAAESQLQSPSRLPSPWRAGPKLFQDNARRNLSFHDGRPRASSGAAMTDTMRKYNPFNIPSSLSKSYKDFHFSLPSFPALSLDARAPAMAAAERRRRGTISNTTNTTPQSGSPQRNIQPIVSREHSDSSTTTLKVPLAPQEPRLRRSNSEGSLLVYRTKSFASSLGDDTRFESVQEQVNSRLKAIRDSWADSSFKLPNPSFPNFNFGSKDDLFKIRNGNTTPKAREMHDDTNQRVTFGASVPAKTTRPALKDSIPDAESHPFFSQALQELEGDLVILGGYRGSILRSAEPPHRQLWVPIKVGLNLRKVDLEVPLDPDADERMKDTIFSSGMLTHIGPIDISRRLFKRLKACENVRNGKLRVHNYGYDWRLSPHFLSREIIKFLESLPCNQPGVPIEKRGAIVLAHSLGGLIVRHAINQRPELVSGVVYAGVPERCVNILGPFRNGDDVLFSSRVLTAQVNFSIRTSYALLPLDGKCFFNKHTKEEYPVDFFDVNTWKECRLSPCIAASEPRPDTPKDSILSVSGLMSAMSQALPTFPSRKSSTSLSKGWQSNNPGSSSSPMDAARDVADVTRNAAEKVTGSSAQTAGVEPKMSPAPTSDPIETSKEPNPATDVTIPYDKAVDYLTRVLAETKAFKQELAHNAIHTESNSYPPIALIYGKSTPTVYGAKVESREAIKRADVYDELAFASGDGVVLARAAMVPKGYSVVRGGVVSSDRGHVTLLGDLEAVGRCLQAVMLGRRNGVGMGDVGKQNGGVNKKGEEVDMTAVVGTTGTASASPPASK